MYDFALSMILFFSIRKSTLLTGPIWPRYYKWLASLMKYLWITIELFPNGCMQDKTLENSTARWWIKCLLVVWWLDGIMTNFVWNVYKSDPKFWCNIIQHADTNKSIFHIIKSNFSGEGLVMYVYKYMFLVINKLYNTWCSNEYIII